MTDLNLKKNPTLKDFQKWIVKMREERGFAEETIIEECLLLGEEVGELFKAVRKYHTNIIYDNQNSKKIALENELADVFNMLLCVANSAEIDLEDAFREKEKINSSRKWE